MDDPAPVPSWAGNTWAGHLGVQATPEIGSSPRGLLEEALRGVQDGPG